MKRRLKNGQMFDRDSGLHYDRCAFDSVYPRKKLAFEDYVRMGWEAHALRVHRPYGEWLNSDAKIKEVLSIALTGAPTSSLDNLRNSSHTKWTRWFRFNWHRPEGAARYRAVRAAGFDVVTLYGRLIFYFKLGFDSRQIAELCGMSRVAVRQRIAKLNRIAAKLYPSS